MKHPITPPIIFFLALLLSSQQVAAQALQNSVYLTKSALPPGHKYCCGRPEGTGLSYALQLASNGISESQAASIAKKAFGGEVIKVSRKGKAYQVKLLKNGRVRIVKVDATSGKILSGR